MKYLPIDNKSALHKLYKRGLPYSYDLNIYRGCEHGCIYCYAIYSHKYLTNDDQFFDAVYYKKNITTTLEKELSAPSWKKDIINIGGVCDSYQPIESKLKIMRDVLKIMIKYKNPIIISTKSTLILRDLDLLKELSKHTYVGIAMTITSLDEDIRRIIEPGASKTISRLQVLKKLKQEADIVSGIHMMPIIPYMTDSEDNLKTIFHLAKDIGVDYVLPGVMYLRGQTKPYFLHKIKDYNPIVYQSLNELYNTPSLKKEYKNNLYKRINIYRKKYSIQSNYTKDIPKEFL